MRFLFSILLIGACLAVTPLFVFAHEEGPAHEAHPALERRQNKVNPVVIGGFGAAIAAVAGFIIFNKMKGK